MYLLVGATSTGSGRPPQVTFIVLVVFLFQCFFLLFTNWYGARYSLLVHRHVRHLLRLTPRMLWFWPLGARLKLLRYTEQFHSDQRRFGISFGAIGKISYQSSGKVEKNRNFNHFIP